MLTFLTMKQRVGRRIGKTDSEYLVKIGEFLNDRYDEILTKYSWRQSLIETEFSSVAGVETAVISKRIKHIIDIYDRLNDIHLTEVDPTEAGRVYADSVDTSGIPRQYFRIDDTVNAQPTSASTLSIVSSDASDTSQKVRIWGIAGGEEVSELVDLNGTTPAVSTYSYTQVDRISKDSDTEGTVTLTANSGAVTVATISPLDVSPRYAKIHLIQRPQSALTYSLIAKINAPELVNDEDVPILPCHNVMIIGAYSDCLREQRQFSKAIEEEKRFDSRLSELWSEFEQFSDRVPRSLPHVERDSLDVPR